MEHRLTIVQKETLALERFFPHQQREKAEQLFFACSVLFLSLSVLFNLHIETRFGVLWPVSQGLFLVSFALFLGTLLIEVYFHSLRLRLEKEHEMSFATLLVIALHHPKKKDLAKAFLHSSVGKEVMERLGVAKESVHRFMLTKDPAEITIPLKGFFPDLASHLHEQDDYFRGFLDDAYISKKHFVDAASVTEKKHHAHLGSRPFLSALFHEPAVIPLNIDSATRHEIEDIESFYKVIITEQATQSIVSFFEDHMVKYSSPDTRVGFLTSLIEDALLAHGSRFHGASVIMPADVRHYLISHKATL